MAASLSDTENRIILLTDAEVGRQGGGAMFLFCPPRSAAAAGTKRGASFWLIGAGVLVAGAAVSVASSPLPAA